jgi:hypothetical protein
MPDGICGIFTTLDIMIIAPYAVITYTEVALLQIDGMIIQPLIRETGLGEELSPCRI